MTKDSKIRGSSKSVKDLRLLIEKVAITNSTVLVLGEKDIQTIFPHFFGVFQRFFEI